MKAALRAPSPRSLLKRLGIRKATKKASAVLEVPKRLAMSMSRAKPRILLIRVKEPMVRVAPATPL